MPILLQTVSELIREIAFKENKMLTGKVLFVTVEYKDGTNPVPELREAVKKELGSIKDNDHPEVVDSHVTEINSSPGYKRLICTVIIR
jgi:hypothetical protein